jgi:hypothetical protein
MGYHGKKRPRRPARHAFALLPVPDGLNRHAQPRREFQLCQTRTPAKVANRRKRSCRFGGGQSRRRLKRKLPPIPQLDDPPVCFQPQALHVRPSHGA